MADSNSWSHLAKLDPFDRHIRGNKLALLFGLAREFTLLILAPRYHMAQCQPTDWTVNLSPVATTKCARTLVQLIKFPLVFFQVRSIPGGTTTKVSWEMARPMPSRDHD